VTRFGDDSPEHRVASAKTLGTVLHLHRGTPFVYQGEELGMTNASFTSIEDYRDIESIRYHAQALAAGVPEAAVMRALALKGRDNARTPMQWDAGPHAGFTTGEPWLPANPNHVEINAVAARSDPSSVFHHYRALIALRHDHPLVTEGRFRLLLPDHPAVWAFERRGAAGHRLAVVANCSSAPVALSVDELAEVQGGADAGAATVLVATHPGRTGADLLPWESRVLELGAQGVDPAT
jgi:oligo-1,6-glucosidase